MPFPALDALANTAFGTGFAREDSQYFTDTPIDPAMRKETDGGLIFTRRQYTRTPARIIVTGWTALPHTYKTLLDQLWNQQGGGAYQFQYVHPLDNTTLLVRFEEPYTMVYKGIGSSYQVWDITSCKLRTV